MAILQLSGEEQNSLRVVTHTPIEQMDERQKGYKNRCFFRLVSHLLLTDACIAAAFLLELTVFCIPGIFFALWALLDIRSYGELVTGRGLFTVYLFMSDRLRMMECEQMADVMYTDMTMAVLTDIGLVLRFRDGSGRVLQAKDLEESACGEELKDLLRRKLGSRFRNRLLDADFQQRKQEEALADRAWRVERLGPQMTEVSYDVDSVDRRDYCRLVTKTGGTGVLFRVLIPVMGALSTGVPILSLILESSLLNGLSYLFVCLLMLVLLPTVVGLGGPGKRRFLAPDGETVLMYVHEKGVYAEGGGKKVLVLWENLSALRYHPDLGMALDMGKQGVLFLPVDLTTEEMFHVLEQKADTAMKKTRPCKGRKE